MKKTKIILLLFIFIVIYIYVVSITFVPNSIVLVQGEKIKLATLWGIDIEETSSSNPNVGEYKTSKILQASNNSDNTLEQVGKINLNINLFKNISLKNVTVNIVPNTKVIPLGNAIGLKLYTKGILVVGMSEIEGIRPYEDTGIEEGDRIIAVNNIVLSNSEDLIQVVNESEGNEVEVKFVSSNNEEKIVEMTPVKTKENEYKLGLWVRDAAAGVGTLTFYEPSTGIFASLGHGITDVDTGDLITIANGELVTSNIVNISKGEKGNPGEIRGSIEGREQDRKYI